MLSNTANQDAIDLVGTTFHKEYGQLLAALISQFDDFSLAEDAVQDAILIALETWPFEGIPHNPGAWILVVARRRAIDRVRRKAAFIHKLSMLMDQEAVCAIEREADEMDGIFDERLKLMFTCCHPALDTEAQIALTLRTVGGLSTDEVARAFLVPPDTMTKRLTRAKVKLREARIPFQIPPAHLLPERLDALLAVLYLIFTEGYRATRGANLIRRDLCVEAIRLTRVLISLLPEGVESPEAYGLLALLLLHDSRRSARTNSAGELILLSDQNRGDWDQVQISEGLAVLERAFALRNPGPYQVQAAISALHAQATGPGNTDWRQITALYDILMRMTPTMVVQVNRAVAVGMSDGLDAGLHALEAVDDAQNYSPFHAAKADLLRRSKDYHSAALAYHQAIMFCQNDIERSYLSRRLAELESMSGN